MKVAVLGYGTVGAGVYSMLSDAPGMEAGPVIVRPGKAVESFMVSDAALIFGDPTVDAVVETLGGLDPAYSYGMRALEAGKHFITANKVMVASHGLELAALAREKGAAFLFSAACGGGVPFLHNLALSAETDRIEAVSGILNGIDVVGYDPATDKNLYETYDAKHLEGKAVNKAKLQERLGLAVDPDVPLIGMVTRLVSHKGLDLVKGGVDNIMTYSNAQFVVLGSGDWEYEQFFKEMQAKYPGRFVLCQGFVPELARKIYGGSDIFLMPSKSEPCGLSQMVALRYGSIPVVRETGGLKDSITDSGDGKGNGFTFQTYDTQDMLNSVHRAIYAYNESKDGWKVLVERAMACDNSWGRSANDYIRLYKQLINS